MSEGGDETHMRGVGDGGVADGDLHREARVWAALLRHLTEDHEGVARC